MTKTLGTSESSYHLLRDLHARPDPHPTRTRSMAHHLDFPPHLLFNPLASFPSVALIHPHFFQARKHPFDRLQQEPDPLTILKISRMDHDFEEQPGCIHDHMSLASIELFGPIIAMRPTAVGCFHRLAVDDGGTGSGFASRLPSTAFS